MTLVREQAVRRPTARVARSRASTQRNLEWHMLVLGIAALVTLLASDWIAGAGVLVLWLIWILLDDDARTPVLPLALSFQWFQVTCGVYYLAFTGRELEAHYASDYRPMVMIGLGCVAALTFGLAMGLRTLRAREARAADTGTFVIPWRTLLIAYGGTSLANALLQGFAWSYPGITQALLACGFLRLGILFLIFRRLVRQRFHWEWFFGFLLVELMLGFTGYFAGFREPLMLAALALLEVFRWRSVKHWFRLVSVVALMGVAGLMWMGIRTVYRAEIDTGQLGGSRVERLGRIGELSSEWLGDESGTVLDDLDQLADRMWTVYYPALAIARVPEVLPHENGAIMLAALKHLITPRLLFPDKGVLISDSEMVRKYSGVYVASTEENTTIAFGYAAEAYVDFGLPLMFVPSILFGIVMGVAYRGVFRVILHDELAVGLACLVFWLSLYLFERSWVRTLGTSVTLMIVVGTIVYCVDRWLLRRRARRTRPALARGFRSEAARAR